MRRLCEQQIDLLAQSVDLVIVEAAADVAHVQHAHAAKRKQIHCVGVRQSSKS